MLSVQPLSRIESTHFGCKRTTLPLTSIKSVDDLLLRIITIYIFIESADSFCRCLTKMGLAPVLNDTYRKYKMGTANFVQWLAETARATGTVNHVFSKGHQGAIPKSRARLKGNARKEAKTDLSQDASPTYQVTINTFTVLAKAIAEDKSTSVLLSVFRTLQAVIQGPVMLTSSRSLKMSWTY